MNKKKSRKLGSILNHSNLHLSTFSQVIISINKSISYGNEKYAHRIQKGQMIENIQNIGFYKPSMENLQVDKTM